MWHAIHVAPVVHAELSQKTCAPRGCSTGSTSLVEATTHWRPDSPVKRPAVLRPHLPEDGGHLRLGIRFKLGDVRNVPT